MMGNGDKSTENGSFTAHRIWIVNSLKDLSADVKSLDEKVDLVITEIALLKLKSGIWGLLGGAIPVVIGLGVYYLRSTPV